MDSGSFDLKLRRAYEHLQALDSAVKAWIQKEPYEIVDEPDPEPPFQKFPDPVVFYRRIRIARLDPVPSVFPLMIGDCLFNLRSALDHLAFALAVSHAPNMSKREQEKTEFPIFHEPMKPSEEHSKIGCIAPGAIAVIKQLQPFHRGNNYKGDPLWQIHELNRIDKHRTLTLVGAISEQNGKRVLNFKIIGENRGKSVIHGRSEAQNLFPLKTDAVLLRYAAIPEDSKSGVQMESSLALEIAFGEGSPVSSKLVIPTLNAMCDYVRYSVITPLSRFL